MITAEDRIKYRNYLDGAILGIKLIGGLPKSAIKKAVKNIRQRYADINTPAGDVLVYIQALMDVDTLLPTNLNWIIGQILEEAYLRDLISAQELDFLV